MSIKMYRLSKCYDPFFNEHGFKLNQEGCFVTSFGESPVFKKVVFFCITSFQQKEVNSFLITYQGNISLKQI